MDWIIFVLAPILGFLTGIINTISGSGSLLTLPFFIFAGLPATVANGTNRLGILGQSSISTVVLRKQFSQHSPSPWVVIVPAVIASGFGAYTASLTDPDVLKGITGLLLILLIGPVMSNSQKWLRPANESGDYKRKPLLVFLFVLIGFYGGFIQAGAGIFMLAALVLIGGCSLKHANLLKNLTTLCFNIPAFAIFLWQGQVSWLIGLTMMSGQIVGAWIAAKFISDNPQANIWTRYLLIIMLLVSAAKLIWDFLNEMQWL